MAQSSASLRPAFARVLTRKRESHDVATLECAPPADWRQGPGFLPGQFNMLYVFGVGEIPISISGDPAQPERMRHTLRGVGAVSKGLSALKKGGLIGLRGPFGHGWPMAEVRGHDLLLIGGGIGLAPLKPMLHAAINDRQLYSRVSLLYGARSPMDLIFRREIAAWNAHGKIRIEVTVDQADRSWHGQVGAVTGALQRPDVTSANGFAFICGPEVMMRQTALRLLDLGYAPERIFVSLERNMKCAVGHCGRCQFGPHFLCREGPVFRYDRVRSMLAIKEI